MKIIKLIIISSIFFFSALNAYATVVSGSVTVDVTSGCTNGAVNPECTKCSDGNTVPSSGVCSKNISPDLKVTVTAEYVWVTNSDGPVVVSYDPNYGGYKGGGYPYTLSWSKVNGATSCELDHFYNANPNGGSVTWKITKLWDNSTHTFDLICKDENGKTGKDSVTLKYPPVPSNLKTSCNDGYTKAYISWTPPKDFNTFYTRAWSLTKGGYNVIPEDDHTVLYNDYATGTSDSFSVNKDEQYGWNVHTRAENGAFGPGLSGSFTANGKCSSDQEDENNNNNNNNNNGSKVNGDWSGWSGGSSSCPASGTLTRTCTNPAPQNGGAKCITEDGKPALTESKSYNNDKCADIAAGENFYAVYPISTNTKLLPGKKIPYNAKAKIVWTPENVDGCTCSSLDLVTNIAGSCGSSTGSSNGSHLTASLKRDMKYTLQCNTLYGATVESSITVPVDKINAGFQEN